MHNLACMLLVCLALLHSTAWADDYSSDNYCEYYDYNFYFTVSFDKSIALGRSGPSSSQGISFLFDDTASLTIRGEFANDDSDNAENLSATEHFIKNFAKQGCTVHSAMYDGTSIRCEQYEYTIVPHPQRDSYLYIMYNFENDSHHAQYKNIADSLLVFASDADTSKFYKLIKNIAYPFDPADPFKQPHYVCGADRIRQKMLKKSFR